MTVTLHSTTKIVTLQTATGGSVSARIWEGQTDTGIPVHAFVVRVGVDRSEDTSQFERELEACVAPSATVDSVYQSRVVI